VSSQPQPGGDPGKQTTPKKDPKVGRAVIIYGTTAVLAILAGLAVDLLILWAISTRLEVADLVVPVLFTAALAAVLVTCRWLMRTAGGRP
jgi:hypothetical protein